MPANSKYLTKSGWQRFAKISAAILGGYLLTMAFHLTLALWLDRPTVLITAAFSGFIVWAGLMIFAFMSKNGWKIWGIYLGLTVIFSAIIYLDKFY